MCNISSGCAYLISAQDWASAGKNEQLPISLMCRSDRRCHGSQKRQKSLSVTAEAGFNHLIDPISDILDVLEVSCSVVSCCPEGHGCQYYFLIFAKPRQKSQNCRIPDYTRHIFRWTPAILMAFYHVLKTGMHS